MLTKTSIQKMTGVSHLLKLVVLKMAGGRYGQKWEECKSTRSILWVLWE